MAHLQQVITLFCLCLFSSYALVQACSSFEGAADWLGRKFPPGVKGATINAVGSSLPELFTTLTLLFFLGGQKVFDAGIGVTAGSAIFNSAVISFFCIIAVTAPLVFRLLIQVLTLGIVRLRGEFLEVDEIAIDRKALFRDGTALLIAYSVLIYMLSQEKLTWQDGAILIVIYIPYIFLLYWQTKKHEASTSEALEEEEEEEEKEEEEEAAAAPRGAFLSLVTFDFQRLYFKTSPYREGKAWQAWMVLLSAIVVISTACFALGEAIVDAAELLHVHAMVSALFLGAIVSSLPDAILSVKDALKGNYNDAVSNAVGSNTFDICVALGLPIMLFGLTYGDVSIPNRINVLELQWSILVLTAVILVMFLTPKTIKPWQAAVLALLYIGWGVFAILNG